MNGYRLSSSHTFVTEPSASFRSAQAAWEYAAMDLAASDHGADESAQRQDADWMARLTEPGAYVTHDGITFYVRRPAPWDTKVSS